MIDEKLEHDVVIASRIRLARNIADFPFVDNCTPDQRSEIESVVRSGLTDDESLTNLACIDSAQLETLERQFLLDLENVTRQISQESSLDLTQEFGGEEMFAELSLQINEEDHIRITATRNDGDLEAAWRRLSELDDRIESKFNYAFDARWGYLTACPANVGTGMRASVLVHLPALSMTGQIDKVFRSLLRVEINARGMFDEGGIGDFYRISNQTTLGSNETDLIAHVAAVVPAVVRFERQARDFLLGENPDGVRRQIDEAISQLCLLDLADESTTRNEELLHLLSRVRMGIGMGLIGPADAKRVHGLLTLVHLRHRLNLAIAREDFLLAASLRDRIHDVEEARRELLESSTGQGTDESALDETTVETGFEEVSFENIMLEETLMDELEFDPLDFDDFEPPSFDDDGGDA